METAVSVVLDRWAAGLTARDDFGNSRASARFQSEVEDRSSGRNRSPQQAESLEAAGDHTSTRLNW